jgi:hypothetical protein
MPLSYSIDSELGIVRIVVVGGATQSEQTGLADAWSNDPHYKPGMPILLDNRLREEVVSSGHIREMADLTKKSDVLEPGTRCAVVVASDVEFGLTRMYATLAEGGPMETRVFRDIAEAEDWLTGRSS